MKLIAQNLNDSKTYSNKKIKLTYITQEALPFFAACPSIGTMVMQRLIISKLDRILVTILFIAFLLSFAA